MGRMRDIARSLRPGNDHQLAASVSAEASAKRRASHRRTGVAKAAAEGEQWETEDRARDRKGDRFTDWNS